MTWVLFFFGLLGVWLWYDARLDELNEEVNDRRFDRLRGDLRGRIAETERALDGIRKKITRRGQKKNLPPRDPFGRFKPRVKELHEPYTEEELQAAEEEVEKALREKKN